MKPDSYKVLNVAAYRFVEIDDPNALVAAVRREAEAFRLRGTVLIAHEGINLFLAGAESDVRAMLGWLRDDARFADIEVKLSWSETLPFKRLLVKYKREIIRFDQPQLQPLQGRAPALPPSTLQRWLRDGHDDAGREVLMLDTRNAQEVAHGTFHGAVTLPIDRFTQLTEAMQTQREVFRNKTIVSFCTGGIRCEKAALWLEQNGFENVWQLEGGILGYFERVGGEGYDGGCFVFDERVALGPDLLPVARAS